MRTLCKWSRNALRQKKSHLTSFMGFRTILSTSLILSMPGKRLAMSRRIVPWKRYTRQKTGGKAAHWRRDRRTLYGSFAHFRPKQHSVRLFSFAAQVHHTPLLPKAVSWRE